jgi:hypothetical protein
LQVIVCLIVSIVQVYLPPQEIRTGSRTFPTVSDDIAIEALCVGVWLWVLLELRGV